MFTGIIQATGTLKTLTPYRLEITYQTSILPHAFEDLELGDSVAVDGVCLTVVEIQSHGFIVDVSPETLERTTLGNTAQRGYPANLETALRMGSKLGGHLVTGHIDGMGYLEAAIADATSWQLSFRIPPSPTCRYIVSKGSLAVNGISLTIASCNPEGTELTVAVIPHTYEITNLHTLKPGQSVNLEADLLGKYVDKLLASGSTFPYANALASPEAPPSSQIDTHFLAEHGYL